MQQVDRILVPLDGSERGEAILTQVGKLLKREDLEVVLLRVVDTTSVLQDVDTVRLLADERAEAARYLEGLAGKLEDQGVRVRMMCRDGMVAETILKVAGEEGATMIAMSTHGYKGLSRWVLGSIAEKVTRASDLPVLLMRTFKSAHPGAEAWGAEERPFRRILVTVDGSEESLAVVPSAEAFARLFGAKVVLVHVETPAVVAAGAFVGLPGGPPMPPALVEVPDSAEKIVRKAAERFSAAGVPVEEVTMRGEAAGEILDAADRKAIDLIAMATHGRSGISRWVLGSTTEKVLRAATVPMLVVRSSRPADRT